MTGSGVRGSSRGIGDCAWACCCISSIRGAWPVSPRSGRACAARAPWPWLSASVLRRLELGGEPVSATAPASWSWLSRARGARRCAPPRPRASRVRAGSSGRCASGSLAVRLPVVGHGRVPVAAQTAACSALTARPVAQPVAKTSSTLSCPTAALASPRVSSSSHRRLRSLFRRQLAVQTCLRAASPRLSSPRRATNRQSRVALRTQPPQRNRSSARAVDVGQHHRRRRRSFTSLYTVRRPPSLRCP